MHFMKRLYDKIPDPALKQKLIDRQNTFMDELAKDLKARVNHRAHTRYALIEFVLFVFRD